MDYSLKRIMVGPLFTGNGALIAVLNCFRGSLYFVILQIVV